LKRGLGTGCGLIVVSSCFTSCVVSSTHARSTPVWLRHIAILSRSVASKSLAFDYGPPHGGPPSSFFMRCGRLATFQSPSSFLLRLGCRYNTVGVQTKANVATDAEMLVNSSLLVAKPLNFPSVAFSVMSLLRGTKSDDYSSGHCKKLWFALEALIDPGCISRDLGYDTLDKKMKKKNRAPFERHAFRCVRRGTMTNGNLGRRRRQMRMIQRLRDRRVAGNCRQYF
jgi:hypothetical protein